MVKLRWLFKSALDLNASNAVGSERGEGGVLSLEELQENVFERSSSVRMRNDIFVKRRFIILLVCCIGRGSMD